MCWSVQKTLYPLNKDFLFYSVLTKVIVSVSMTNANKRDIFHPICLI